MAGKQVEVVVEEEAAEEAPQAQPQASVQGQADAQDPTGSGLYAAIVVAAAEAEAERARVVLARTAAEKDKWERRADEVEARMAGLEGRTRHWLGRVAEVGLLLTALLRPLQGDRHDRGDGGGDAGVDDGVDDEDDDGGDQGASGMAAMIKATMAEVRGHQAGL